MHNHAKAAGLLLTGLVQTKSDVAGGKANHTTEADAGRRQDFQPAVHQAADSGALLLRRCHPVP